MELPEKVYIHKSQYWGLMTNKCITTEDDIEYTRTDVFIEKACNYLFSHMGLFVTFINDDIVEDIESCEFIKKFRIAMEDNL